MTITSVILTLVVVVSLSTLIGMWARGFVVVSLAALNRRRSPLHREIERLENEVRIWKESTRKLYQETIELKARKHGEPYR